MITGATVEATGDTAAGDNAAMGYSASEGLKLTGQGSSFDVTIQNDAGVNALTVATGTTNVDVVGDLTVGTVTADGDTSAGDNATMGYTSAEGLILTGQGSTSDVTIKNDADATVLSIPTGTSIVGIGTTAASGALLHVEGSSASVTAKFLSGASGTRGRITVGRTATEAIWQTCEGANSGFTGTAEGDMVLGSLTASKESHFGNLVANKTRLDARLRRRRGHA